MRIADFFTSWLERLLTPPFGEDCAHRPFFQCSVCGIGPLEPEDENICHQCFLGGLDGLDPRNANLGGRFHD